MNVGVTVDGYCTGAPTNGFFPVVNCSDPIKATELSD